MGLAEKKYQTPPRTGMEVFQMLPEGTLAELLNDIIYMSPSLSFHHQDLSTELSMQIRAHVKKNKLGTCVSALPFVIPSPPMLSAHTFGR